MSKNPAQKKTYDGVVILVEGKDDYLLVEKLASDDKPNIVDMKGYTNLSNKLAHIQNSTKEFKDGITHLLMIVDADDNFAMRKQEVISELQKVAIILPSTYQLGTVVSVGEIKVGVFILPDNSNIGSLETLLLQSVNHPQLLQCADNMIQCRKTNEPTFDWNTQNKYDKIKFRLHMNSLVVNYDFFYDKTFTSEINYSDECFDLLKQFINI